MIVYNSGPFGSAILFRLHGSAVLKATLPATASTVILGFVGTYYGSDAFTETGLDKKPIDHPYVIGALMAAFTFLIIFRANFAYGRYWGAASDVHDMLSKWTDVGNALASFHYQSETYDGFRPPTFGKHARLQNLSRRRERLQKTSLEEIREQIKNLESSDSSDYNDELMAPLEISGTSGDDNNNGESAACTEEDTAGWIKSGISDMLSIPAPRMRPGRVFSRPRVNGGVSTSHPSLFLQEAAHLLSLMAAVALSTLRCDIEGTESPLCQFVSEAPWPEVDPDKLSSNVRKHFYGTNRLATALQFLVGISRSDENRTLYNAARPFRVVGGVSDAEVRLLQRARGPVAKVALCSMWLQEFITRETMAGSTGDVAPGMMSRLYQYISDGMQGYNQARKVAYVPFPFVHAQLSVFFIAVVVCFLPVLMFSFVHEVYLACLLNFFTVLCFTGLHEVARELENPFVNVPNDLPLSTFLAQFNEGLISMFAGFHPDAWWEAPGTKSTNSKKMAAPNGLEHIGGRRSKGCHSARQCTLEEAYGYGSFQSHVAIDKSA